MEGVSTREEINNCIRLEKKRREKRVLLATTQESIKKRKYIAWLTCFLLFCRTMPRRKWRPWLWLTTQTFLAHTAHLQKAKPCGS